MGVELYLIVILFISLIFSEIKHLLTNLTVILLFCELRVITLVIFLLGCLSFSNTSANVL